MKLGDQGVFSKILEDQGLAFFHAQNKMRTDPKSFIPKLESMLKRFDNKDNPLLISTMDKDIKILTREGSVAV